LAVGDGDGIDGGRAVADDARRVVAIVDPRLERLHRLTCEERPLHATDQLLGLAAEHRADDDLDATHRAPAAVEVPVEVAGHATSYTKLDLDGPPTPVAAGPPHARCAERCPGPRAAPLGAISQPWRLSAGPRA